MRNLLVIIFISLSSALSAFNTTQVRDSLLNVLERTHSAQARVQLYRSLADLYIEFPEEKTYLLGMYKEAQKSNDKLMIQNALNDLIIIESKDYNQDSIVSYINLLRKVTTPEELKRMLPLYRMRFFDTLCYLNKSNEAIEKELGFLDSNCATKSDIYRNISLNYATGTGLYMNEQYERAAPYLQEAMNLSGKLPDKEKFLYQKFIAYRLCYALAQAGRTKESVPIMINLINQIEENYKTNDQKQRPFYRINLYLLQYYTFMISSLPFLSTQQEQYYWNRIVTISKDLTNPVDIYNFHLCANNYYANSRTHKNLRKAIDSNDTLIKIASTLAPKNLPGLYKVNAVLYEKNNDYPNALQHLKLSYQIKDSLNAEDTQKQLNELQVKYEINALNNEKTMLTVKNKQMLVVSLSVILIIVASICTYLFFSLKKEKRMKLKLKFLHIKAQESEKMKQEFINSICHEIRTPLNAIVGFSDLITNEDIDLEMRQEFPAEIQRNTVLLTSLISSMLEVANLDVSEEKLPCQSVDLRDICIDEMERLNRKQGIEYKLDITEESMIISTNRGYLSQVIEHLLSNANKFTEQGRITLCYDINKEKNRICIHVTDTGCGIPLEKHEEVFNRFSKLDTFVSGNGLGLYLCQLIVKRLTGEISIDKDYTEGTRMIVVLPIQ